MTDKQWPKCLRVYPYWEQSGDGFDQENCHIAEPWDLASRDDLSPKEAKYTRSDIAESYIAELETELQHYRTTTQATIVDDHGAPRYYHARSYDAIKRDCEEMRTFVAKLANERNALQRRIDEAPSVEITKCNQIAGASDFDYGDMTEAVAKLKPGQRVAVVVLK